jgi:CDP-diacylglycerol--glycerol-3-phosphate 3-phosphatidyltransferase
MKNVANYISLSRIFLIMALAFFKPTEPAFVGLYIAAGLTDMVDGYVARKTGTASRLGEKLDSFADFFMIVVLLMILLPFLDLSIPLLILTAIIALVRTASMVVVYVRYRTFGGLHTYGNKLTGLLLFIFPVTLFFARAEWLLYLICVVALLSAAEELFIHLTSKELEGNRKGLFF